MSQNKDTYIIPAGDSMQWSINGHTFYLDVQDAEVAENYEAAFAKMAEEEKALPKEGKHSEIIHAYCRMFRNLFCNLFGEGADIKIIGEKDNTRTATQAYESFLEFVSNQQNDIVATQNRVVTRFSPNRAQRRAQGKK